MVYQLGDAIVTHEIKVKDAEFLKVSTNTYGGLRFKTDKEDEAVKMYAGQISTDRAQFKPHQIRNLSGFKVTKVKDATRCLKEKSSQSESLVDSSKTS